MSLRDFGFGIVVEHPKTATNIGTLLRTAFNFRAAFIATVGKRYERQHSDTEKAWREIPLLHFKSWDEYRAHAPFGWVPVAVEFCAAGEDLTTFHHPESACYLLGPEDGSLSREAVAMAKAVVVIPSRRCLNLAVAGSVVMYDRVAKMRPLAPPPGG